MNLRKNPVSRLLQAAQARFNKARSGSVLIMVVAVLVLLALIGTAAMSTARLDRVSSAQNVSNIQIEMLVEGVKNMVVGTVVSDLFSNGVYRDKFTSATSYDDWDSFVASPTATFADTNNPGTSPATMSHDAWMGARLPEIISGNNIYGWQKISYPPLRTGGTYAADFPTDATPRSLDRLDYSFMATSIAISGKTYPALSIYLNGTYVAGPFLAADTDGDGIADSLYFKLPVGSIAGVTYYAAVRVIDNNSAINVNTAQFRDFDFIGSGGNVARGDNDGLFTTNVALAEFLRDYDPAATQINALSQDMNRVLYRKGVLLQNGNLHTPSGLLGGTGKPVNENGANVTPDFSYRTLGDLVYMQLARRLDYPGRIDSSTYFGNGVRPYSFSDGFILAKKFIIRDGTTSPASIEADLYNSAYSAPTVSYLPGQVNLWYGDNFDFSTLPNTNPKRPLRSMLVTNNPTSTYAPPHMIPGTVLFPGINAVPDYPTKVSINTAVVGDLWRGFYEVMCFNDMTPDFGPDKTTAEAVANAADAITDPFLGERFGQHAADTATTGYTATKSFASTQELNPGRMFRTPIRTTGAGGKLNVRQMMALRSAIAAANAKAMREGKTQLFASDAYDIPLDDLNNGSAPKLTARIYTYARQPFITEVFAHTDLNKVKPDESDPNDPRTALKDKQNKKGFIAIELYNPYDTPISLAGYQVAYVDRAGGTLTFKAVSTPTELQGKSIPANDFVVLANYDPAQAEGDQMLASYIPFSVGDQATLKAKLITVHDLPTVIPEAGGTERELVILRTRDGGAVNTSQALEEQVPVDSFDLTGLVMPASDGQPAEAWHYVRANDPGTKAWAFVYPGRYDGTLTTRRQQGTEAQVWSPVDPDPASPNPKPREDEPWAPKGVSANTTILLGKADLFSSRNPSPGNLPMDMAIAIGGKDSPGPGMIGSSNARFPFGGFARSGDIMGVPFIGAYVLFPTTNAQNPALAGQLKEMNSISMDAAFAEDTDTADDKVEDIGRFAPVIADVTADPNDTSLVVNDFDSGGTYNIASNSRRWHYRWAGKVFDYFTTINNPHDDYLPNAQPDPNNAVPNGPDVTTVNDANKEQERYLPVEGLINLNTAHWRVLMALPWLPPRAYDGGQANADKAIYNVARSVAYYRDVKDPATGKPHGPFTSLMELMNVPILDFAQNANNPAVLGSFQNIWGTVGSQDADDRDGDFSPEPEGTKDQVKDYKDRFLSLNRISNLVTLRSDTYTCYVLVQGWRDAGSTSATLEVQRRLAFVIDRSRVRSGFKSPNVYNVPSN